MAQGKIGNGVYATGNSTKDAEYGQYGVNSTHISSWGMAVGKNEDGSTVFVNCKAFGRLALYAKDIKKGDPVFAVGRIESREYNGKTYHELICDWVNFVGSQSEVITPLPSINGGAEVADDSDEILPF